MSDVPKRILVIDILRSYFESGDAADLGKSATVLLAAICMEFDRFHCSRAVSWRIDMVTTRTGLTLNTVVKSRDLLEEAGWLSIEKGVHRKRAAKYTPLLPDGFIHSSINVRSVFDQGSVSVRSTIDGTLTETCMKRDGNVGAYSPTPNTSSSSAPTPTGAQILDQADESEHDIPTELSGKPLSDEQLYQGVVTEDWYRQIHKVAKIGPKSWNKWQDILEHTFSNNLDELVTFCRSYPGECWPDDIKKAYIKKNPQTQAAKHGRKAVEL